MARSQLKFFLICACVLASALADSQSKEECDDDKLLPVKDCKKYMVCSDGELTIKSCPKNRYFNKDTQKCVKNKPKSCKDDDSNSSSEEDDDLKLLYNDISERCIKNSVTTVICPDVLPDDRLLPHPDDCELFYYCITSDLPPICRDCPAGLHFNPIKKVCDHPSTAGCQNKTMQISDSLKCDSNNGVWADLRPDPKNCSKYYVCDWGYLIHMDCPDGLHFNPRLKICDAPASARCENQTVLPVSDLNDTVHKTDSLECDSHNGVWADLRPDPENCSKYYVCDWGNLIHMDCPDGLHFNPRLKICDSPASAWCVNQTALPVSQSDVTLPEFETCENSNGEFADLRPDPTDCNKYYVCNWGHLIPMVCPDGMHYNAELEVCDLPQNAKCEVTLGLLESQKIERNVVCNTNQDIGYAEIQPDPTSCNHFYICTWGQPKRKSCPSGLHFNPVELVCDFPSSAGCEESIPA